MSCGLVGKGQNQKEANFSTQHQYIHCTGNMYVLIPTKKKNKRQEDKGGQQQHQLVKNKHEGGGYLKMTKPAYDHSQTGFLWSWNFMISRRWKQSCNSGATGDIPFMDKMLEDFRLFCSNKDERLERFWTEHMTEKRID